jgi:hypothetical protein
MSEAVDRPPADDDAWATACAEDLAQEKARRRAVPGASPGSAAEELRRLADAVTERLGELRNPGVEMAARAVVGQIKAVGGELRDRNPGVFEHLAAAGGELLSAYRAAVSGAEQRWTREAASGGTGGDPLRKPAPPAGPTGPDDGDEGPAAGPERIDLD